ncbi:hypothetical protein B0H14DRAFT_2616551 [Mycena olivaceomarginata]|nr:hypothetical protein B0H14DRAFT_2616551 [Mycena olivaceomarginata]
MKSAKSLRLLSWCFHSMLVLIHLALIPVWVKRLENRVLFALNYQSIVSFLITAVTQTFGTVYLAVLVLVTQKLSMRRNLVTAQPLTATHDTTAAWAGIGSAFLHLCHQKAVRTSITGILSVCLYLGTVLVLHITTPALFALETFNSTSTSEVLTEGLPAMNMSGYNGTNNYDLWNYVYIAGSLYYLPYVDGSTSVGLTRGTLYDVPKTNAAIGTITVNATGFNVTCQFFENSTAGFSQEDSFSKEDSGWAVSSGSYTGLLESTQPRVISTPQTFTGIGGQNAFYSTIPIVDSNNNTGGVVRLDPPMNSTATVSSVQLFQCFVSVVEQTAVLDGESKKMVALHPKIVKNTSTWSPGNPDQTFPTTGNPLIDEWGWWYSTMPTSDFPRDPAGSGGFLSLADLYLIEKLNLHPANQTFTPSAVALHDLENALSELVATMFWTKCHGDRTVSKNSIRRSVVLMLLSLQHSLPREHHEEEQDLAIDGTGLLHAIWLYRNHPELEPFLEQVAHPTDCNLRHAGMAETESMDSFHYIPKWQNLGAFAS